MITCTCTRLYMLWYVLITVPSSAPTNVCDKAKTARSVTFEWRAISCDKINGAWIQYRYTLQGIEYDNRTWTGTSHGVTWTARDLVPYALYSFTVTAVNNEGSSAESDVIRVRTNETSRWFWHSTAYQLNNTVEFKIDGCNLCFSHDFIITVFVFAIMGVFDPELIWKFCLPVFFSFQDEKQKYSDKYLSITLMLSITYPKWFLQLFCWPDGWVFAFRH